MQHPARALHERPLGDGIVRREANLRPAHDLPTIIDPVRDAAELGIISEVSQVNHPALAIEKCVMSYVRDIRKSDDLTFVVDSGRHAGCRVEGSQVRRYAIVPKDRMLVACRSFGPADDITLSIDR